MKTILCLLFGLSNCLGASPPDVQVRVVTFDALESEWLEQAAKVPVGEASSSFARLVAGVGNGSVTQASDIMVHVRSGSKSKNEGLVEFPYPTEFDPQEERQFPASFEFKNSGTTLECEATAEGGWINLNLAIDSIRLREMRQIPAIVRIGGTYQQGAVPQPVFLTENIATQVACLSGVPVLIAQSRPADLWDERPGGASQRTLLTFVIASLRGEFPADASGGKPAQSRLHVAGVRMEAEAALALLKVENNMGSRFAQATVMAAEGRAVFVYNGAVICRAVGKSQMNSISEFPWPTEMGGAGGLIPQSFEFYNMGDSLGCELSADGTSVSLDNDLYGRPVMHRSLPWIGQPGVALEMSEFRWLNNHFSQLSLPSGVWKQVGVSTCQDDERSLPGKGNSIVWFACLASGLPVPEGPSTSLYAATINLDPAEVAAWKARPLDEALTADLIQQAVLDDRLKLIGALTGQAGTAGVGFQTQRHFPDTNKLQEAIVHHGLSWAAGQWTLKWPVADSTGPELSDVIAGWQLREADPDALPPRTLERTWTMAGSGETFRAEFVASEHDTGMHNLNFQVAETYLPTAPTKDPLAPVSGGRPYIRKTRKDVRFADLSADDQEVLREFIAKYIKWKKDWEEPKQVKTWQAEMKLTQLPEVDGKWHFAGWNETQGPDGIVTTAILLRRE